MKSSSFKRNNESVFQVLQEEPRNKKKTNWDRIIYFSIASIAVVFLFYALSTRLFYIHADGHILFEKVKVQIPTDIRISQFYFGEGDSVSKGDSLFRYVERERGYGGAFASVNGGSNWRQKEVFNTQKKISLNNLEIEGLNELIIKHKENLEALKKEVSLDLIPKSKLEYFKKQIDENEINRDKLVKENIYLKNYLYQVKNAKEGISGVAMGGNGRAGGAFKFYSPLDGTITRIHKKPHEVALKSEAILTIHKRQNIYIKGFFEQSDLRYLEVGDEVDLEFPDGTTSQGVIAKFYFATYTLSPEFQKRYEPVQRRLGVDVYPKNDEELKKWKDIYKMGVKISKSKYW